MSLQTDLNNLPLISVAKKINQANAIIPRSLQWALYALALVLSDASMIFLSFKLAYYFRFELFVQYFTTVETISVRTYQILLYPVPFLWLVIFAINGLYSKDNLHGNAQESSRVFRSTTEGFLLIVIIGFLDPTLIFARGWLFMAWGMTFLLVSFARVLIRGGVYALRRWGLFLTPAVIVGANQEGRWLAAQLLNWQKSGLHLVGFVDNKEPVTFPLFHDLVSLGSVDQLGEIIERYRVGEIILASSAFSTRDHLLEIFRKYSASEKINIRMSSGLYEILTTGLTVNEIAFVPLVNVNRVRLSGMDTVVKAALDYVVTIIGLIVISPLLLLIAFLVRVSSPGPVIYSRQVMGLNGKKFAVYKFRTMYTNGDEILDKHPELKDEFLKTRKLRNDPRVTPVGALLRKFSLDELPQLINVLKREMSLVGPRMIPPVEIAMYKQFDMNLLTVLPGITGLWQVSGRSDVSYEERVQLDMYYIRNWSIWLDLRVLLQTIPAVLMGRGAY